MGLKLVTAPSAVMTLEEAKAHLRVVDDDEDSLITSFVKAATNNAEAWTGRAFVDQTWELYLDEFPSSDDLEIKIPKPPLIEVVSIKYDDASGNEQTLDPANYYVDNVSEPGWVVPTGSLTWPSTIDAINSVRIRFRAGYLSLDSPPVAAVPEDVKAAIKLTLGSLYEHRETMIVGSTVSAMPWSAEQLLRDHRVQLGMA